MPPLDYDLVMGSPPIDTRHVYTTRDTILYALGVGAGAQAPTDPSELQFVYEPGLKALPTMATVLTYPGNWARDPRYGLTWWMVVHGEQSIRLHKRLPVEGALRGETRFQEIYDKGVDKGAIVYSSREVYDEATGDHLATVSQSTFLRADGGFGGKSEGAPRPHPMPDRAPDLTVRTPTRPDQALLYRLSGDYNPLHIDPKVAKDAGYPAPILHGLGTYGFVGRMLLGSLCDNEPEKVKRIDARFSSPVFPGETLEVDIWREGAGRAAYRARVVERDVVVLQNGYLEYEV